MIRAISKLDYKLLLELDKSVYPTNNPVTDKVLDSWYSRNPEFGIVFEYNGVITGFGIAIPLNKSGWNNLISGKLSEADLNLDTLFDNKRDKEIGIHIYHIEKLGNQNNFYELVLKELSNIISNLREFNPNLKVIGFSGLCSTSQGISLFYNKLNCKERDFLRSEHILQKDGKLIIFDSNSQKELSLKIKDGYKYINRCKMLVLYPNDLSIVWDYLS